MRDVRQRVLPGGRLFVDALLGVLAAVHVVRRDLGRHEGAAAREHRRRRLGLLLVGGRRAAPPGPAARRAADSRRAQSAAAPADVRLVTAARARLAGKQLALL